MADNATLNSTAPIQDSPDRLDSSIDYGVEYAQSLPSLVMQGDYFAIILALLFGYILLVTINQLTGLFLAVIKRIISFIITILALLLIYTKFMDSLATQGWTVTTIIIGVIGIVIGIAGCLLSFYALFHHTKHAISHGFSSDAEPAQTEVHVEGGDEKGLRDFLSFDNLKEDKSILSVLTFLVVAQFGVFSSNTISAPTVQTGLIMFSIFMALTFVFIKQSYKHYARGLSHVIITFVLGTVLAFVLGHYWANIPLNVLLSLEVFTTDVLVALISGMALSLFAGSKS